MDKLPTWVKALIAIVIFAALYGITELLFSLDSTAGGMAGQG